MSKMFLVIENRMKYFGILLYFTLIAIGGCAVAPEDPVERDQWYQTMAEVVKEPVSTEAPIQRIEKLGWYTAFLERVPDYEDARWQEGRKMVRQALIAIPDHAEFFARRVEAARAEDSKLPRVNQNRYDRDRYYNLVEIIGKIPSPQAVTVLGRYLDDEKDVPPTRQHASENAFLAAQALSQMHLRDFPVAPFYYWERYSGELKDPLPDCRRWFREVKAGTRWFSFSGQDVGYRFAADGTVETRRLEPSERVDPIPPVRPRLAAVFDPVAAPAPVPSEKAGTSRWFWAGGIIVLTAAAAFAWRRISASSRSRS